jgi:hypothetical protein
MNRSTRSLRHRLGKFRRAGTTLGGLLACAGLLIGPAMSVGAAGRPLRVLQLNLCDSGFAVCYTGRSVAEAASLIRTQTPEVVTLNEVCRGDLAALDRAMADSGRGDDVVSRFTPALDRRTGQAIRCRNGEPYGIGVLARTPGPRPDYTTTSGIYPIQDVTHPEQRAWLCLRVPGQFSACTTHLASTDPQIALAQCRYLLGTVIPGTDPAAAALPTVLGGDFNLQRGLAPDLRFCLPTGFQHVDRAVQHILATADLRVGSVRSLDMHGTTDHPGLLASLARS